MIIQLSRAESIYLQDHIAGALRFTDERPDNPDMKLSGRMFREILARAAWGRRLELDADRACLLAQGLAHVAQLPAEEMAGALLSAVAEQVLEKLTAALEAEGIAFEYSPGPEEGY